MIGQVYGRKQPWCKLRNGPVVYLPGLRIRQKSLDKPVCRSRFELGTFRIQVRIVIAWNQHHFCCSLTARNVFCATCMLTFLSYSVICFNNRGNLRYVVRILDLNEMHCIGILIETWNEDSHFFPRSPNRDTDRAT